MGRAERWALRKGAKDAERKTQEHRQECLCHKGEERPASEGRPYNYVGEFTV
jgi:hypothetical protein